MEDRPKSLREKAERMAREQLLKQKHILPLTCFVEEVRQEEGLDKYVPYFDPLDGGIEAQCLFVLEAPGAKTKESGFVSRNNNDETAKNFFEFNVAASIPREKTITWNIVPWYIGTDKKIKTAKRSDIDVGLPYLHRLMKLLPDVRIIVLVGRKAQQVEKELRLRDHGIDILHSFHPSPRHVNPDKLRNSQVIINQLRQVSRTLDVLTKK